MRVCYALPLIFYFWNKLHYLDTLLQDNDMKSTRHDDETKFTSIKIPVFLRNKLHLMAISNGQFMYQTIAQMLVNELEKSILEKEEK